MPDASIQETVSYSLIPSIIVGLKDAINPCGIATALIFLMFLSRIGYTKRHIFWTGFLLILFTAYVHFGLTMGLFDEMLAIPMISNFMRVIYLCLGLLFLVFGVLHFNDWRQYKTNCDTKIFRLQLPVYLRSNDGKRYNVFSRKGFVWLATILLAVPVWLIIILMESEYPQSEYIFILHSYFMAGGDQRFVFQSVFLYCATLVIPLIIVWIAVYWLADEAAEKPKVISYYKGILSALFLSTGLGLVYFLMR